MPFIEEKRLLDAMAKRYPELTEEEVHRNGTGKDAIMVSEENPLYNQICSLYMKRKVDEVSIGKIDTEMNIGLIHTYSARTDGHYTQQRRARHCLP